VRPRLVYFDQWTDPVAGEVLADHGGFDVTRLQIAGPVAANWAGLERAHAGAITSLWEAWNRRGEAQSREARMPDFPGAWAEFAGRREALQAHAGKWAAALAQRRDLAAEIVDFVDNTL